MGYPVPNDPFRDAYKLAVAYYQNTTTTLILASIGICILVVLRGVLGWKYRDPYITMIASGLFAVLSTLLVILSFATHYPGMRLRIAGLLSCIMLYAQLAAYSWAVRQGERSLRPVYSRIFHSIF